MRLLVDLLLLASVFLMLAGVELLFAKLQSSSFDSDITRPEQGLMLTLSSIAAVARHETGPNIIVLAGMSLGVVCLSVVVFFRRINMAATLVVHTAGMLSVCTVHAVYVVRSPSRRCSPNHEMDWLDNRALINFVTYCVLLVVSIGTFTYLLLISHGRLLLKSLAGFSIIMFSASPIIAASSHVIVGLILIGICLAVTLPISVMATCLVDPPPSSDLTDPLILHVH